MRGHEVITHYAKDATDWEGNPIDPQAPPVEIPGCIIWPRQADENPDESMARVIDGLNVFIPTANLVAMDANDRVFARGKMWELDGEVGEFRNFGGRRKGYIFQLTKTS